MLRIADIDPSVGIVGSVLLDADGSDRVQAWGGGRVNRWLGTTRTNTTSHGGELTHIVGASMLLRTRMLLQIGLFDERYFFYLEDTDLSYRAHRSGWRLAVADDAIVWHRHGATVNAGSRQRSLRSDIHYARGSAIFLASHAPTFAFPAVFALRAVALVGRRLARGEGGRTVTLLRQFVAGTRAGFAPAVIPRVTFDPATGASDVGG
jgi:GT2 family glycosyltransferase